MACARQQKRWTSPAETLTPGQAERRNTGLGLTSAQFRSQTERQQRMLDSDFILAEKLASRGISVYSGRNLTWLGDVTGETVQLSPLRQVNIFESCMQAKRSFYLKALEHFGENCPGRKYFRYTVVTTQRRIKEGESVDEIKRTVMRRISTWQRIIAKRYDIEVLLNVGEYTFEKDTRTFFFHFNILQWPHVYLKNVKCVIDGQRSNMWDHYLRFTWDFLGVHWKDNKKCNEFKELMKYVLKGHETGADGKAHSVDPRREMTPSESEWLFDQLYRRRFIVTYGALRASIRELRQNRQKLCYVAAEGGAKKQLRVVQMPPLQPAGEVNSENQVRETENVIRGRTLPMQRATAWAEPGTLIEGYTPVPTTPGGRARLARLHETKDASLEAWHANGAPAPAVAVSVSKAWLCAGDDHQADAVKPFAMAKNAIENIRNKPRPAQPAGSMVHTTDLTIHATGPPKALCAVSEGAEPVRELVDKKTATKNEKNKNIILGTQSYQDRDGKTCLIHFDTSTGEIID